MAISIPMVWAVDVFDINQISDKNSNYLINTILNGRAGTAMPRYKEKFSKVDAEKMVEYLKLFKLPKKTAQDKYVSNNKIKTELNSSQITWDGNPSSNLNNTNYVKHLINYIKNKYPEKIKQINEKVNIEKKTKVVQTAYLFWKLFFGETFLFFYM